MIYYFVLPACMLILYTLGIYYVYVLLTVLNNISCTLYTLHYMYICIYVLNK